MTLDPAIWDNTGRGNEEAGWYDQSEARFGSVLANQKAREAMMRRPHCNELSDIEPMSTTTVKLLLSIHRVLCLHPPSECVKHHKTHKTLNPTQE